MTMPHDPGPDFSEEGVTDLWEKGQRASKRRERWRLVRQRVKELCGHCHVNLAWAAWSRG
jgi:hypothetical protein